MDPIIYKHVKCCRGFEVVGILMGDALLVLNVLKQVRVKTHKSQPTNTYHYTRG